MKHLIFKFCLILSAVLSNSNGLIVSGIVIGRDSKPIFGAEVKIGYNGGKDFTNSLGAFRIDLEPTTSIKKPLKLKTKAFLDIKKGLIFNHELQMIFDLNGKAHPKNNLEREFIDNSMKQDGLAKKSNFQMYYSIQISKIGFTTLAYDLSLNADTNLTIALDSSNSWINTGVVSAGHPIAMKISSNNIFHILTKDSTRTIKCFEKVDARWKQLGDDHAWDNAYMDNSENGIPYIAAKEGAETSVLKWNGISWENIGKSRFILGEPNGISISKDSIPYIAVKEVDGNSSILKWSNRKWEYVGARELFKEEGFSLIKEIKISKSNTLYVLLAKLQEINKYQSWNYALMKWNTETISWQYVGGSSISPGMQNGNAYLSISSDDVPYVVMTEKKIDRESIMLKRWNGNEWGLLSEYQNIMQQNLSGFTLSDSQTQYITVSKSYYERGAMKYFSTIYLPTGGLWASIGGANYKWGHAITAMDTNRGLFIAGSIGASTVFLRWNP